MTFGSSPPDDDINRHLHTLFAGQADGWIELAHGWRDNNGSLRMGSRSDPANYFPISEDRAAAHRARQLAGRGEVFVGVIPRAVSGMTGAGGVRHVGRVIWIDIDDEKAAKKAARFGPAAHLAVASGGGGVHLYWLLDRLLPVESLELINRRLAVHLGADQVCCDRGRIMRVAGTPHKIPGISARIMSSPGHRPLSPARLLTWVPRLLEEPTRRPAHALRPQPVRPGDRDPVRGLQPAVWFVALTGAEPDEWGSVRCPLPDHDDPQPSCHVYPQPERGWWCFGCGRGGSAYDLASLLEGGAWGRDLRGPEFREAKARVWRALGIRDARHAA